MLPFAAAVFSGAFLLFQVQPILGKYLLPGFGGAAGVWAMCLVFFQGMLVLGYAYAHVLRRAPLRAQWIAHGALLAGGALFLPLSPGEPSAVGAGRADGAAAQLEILLVLLRAVGLPYLALAGTSPLLASWAERVFEGPRVYRLFALSNAGSLLALVSFPVLVEPTLTRVMQGRVWAVGYLAFAIATVLAGRRALSAPARGSEPPPARAPAEEELSAEAFLRALRTKREGPVAATPAARLGWFLWSALGSALLVATTNQLGLEIAAVPFLWIVPLALYLLTFVVLFERPALYDRRWAVPAFFLAAHGMLFAVVSGLGLGAEAQLALYPGCMFVVCAVLHGELVRARPPAKELTAYYLLIAGGGAVGGALVAVAAPVCLTRLWDLPIVVLVSAFALSVAWVRALGRRAGFVWAAGAALLLLTAVLAAGPMLRRHVRGDTTVVLRRGRNFYGTLLVEEAGRGEKHKRTLLHGQTMHGSQYVAAERAPLPTTYYGETSGVGRAILALRKERGRVRVGAVGLGVGTLAAYARPGDAFVFYELNPLVERFAREEFSFLRAAEGQARVVLGDARLSLAREVGGAGAARYDLLALDAFSSDSIPVHLLTEEAFRLYRRLVGPEGTIVVHISNRFLDLEPVVRGAAARLGWVAAAVEDGADAARGTDTSRWVLLAPGYAAAVARSGLTEFEIRHAEVTAKRRPPVRWTDDHTSVWPLLRF